MINDLNNTLKQLLINRIPLDQEEVDITFDCPKREWSSKLNKPTINLYLFDLREDIELRASDWIIERDKSGVKSQRRPPVYISMSYFVTTWAREVIDEHLLLWRCLTALMRERAIGDDLLQGTLRGQREHIKTATAQADGVLRNPGEFWSALDNDLKPAVVYSATLPVELDVVIHTPIVLTKRIEVSDIGLDRKRVQLAIGGQVRSRHAAETGELAFVARANVTFPNLGITVRSDEDGRFVVPDIPQGRHRVRVTTLEGAEAEREMEVPSADYDMEV